MDVRIDVNEKSACCRFVFFPGRTTSDRPLEQFLQFRKNHPSLAYVTSARWSRGRMAEEQQQAAAVGPTAGRGRPPSPSVASSWQ